MPGPPRRTEEVSLDDESAGQVSASAAQVYDDYFLPALMLAWAVRVADAAQLAPGQRVLDVACGTGALTLEAARRVAPGGAVVGLDRNEDMLSVARRKDSAVEWRSGPAESLPFADGSFDAVISQFGLMFFSDRVAAVREMWRVLRPGGRVAVAVWAPIERSPGYADLAALVARLFGDRAAAEVRAPFALGDADELRSVFARAGVPDADVRTPDGTVRYPSLDSWMQIDVRGWTLAELIDDAQFATLLAAARAEFRAYEQPDGSIVFPIGAHIATAEKPS